MLLTSSLAKQGEGFPQGMSNSLIGPDDRLECEYCLFDSYQICPGP
jgi:hypothetical protein